MKRPCAPYKADVIQVFIIKKFTSLQFVDIAARFSLFLKYFKKLGGSQLVETCFIKENLTKVGSLMCFEF